MSAAPTKIPLTFGAAAGAFAVSAYSIYEESISRGQSGSISCTAFALSIILALGFATYGAAMDCKKTGKGLLAGAAFSAILYGALMAGFGHRQSEEPKQETPGFLHIPGH